MKKISVVTINYNSEKATENLLNSLKDIDTDDFVLDIIVVDNASKIPYKLISEDKNRNITLIRSEINTGFSGGNNIGIKYAIKSNADYLLIINNDTTIEKDALIKLKNVIDKEQNIGVSVPKIYFAKGYEYQKKKYNENEMGRVIWYAGGYMDWNNAKSEHIGMDEVDNGQFDNKKNIDFATGCCMLIKKEVLEKIGSFDERYFLYYEDSDLSIRIKRAGYNMRYVPEAIVYHANAQSSGGSGSDLHDYFLTRNQMLFGMRYTPLKTKIALIRQSFNLLTNGRIYQKRGIQDYYLQRFGKGTYFAS